MKKFNVKKSNSLTTCFLLIISFFLIGEVGAATYYVAPNGNDSNSGSISAPFKTIQKAADIVNPGDTVYLRGGLYNQRVVLRRSGTAGNFITFQNYPGETAILDGTGLGTGIMFWGHGASYIKVIGLKIRNHTGSGIQFQPNVSNGFRGSNLEIRNNEIYNQSYQPGYGHAILVVTWPYSSDNSYTDIIVDGNYIHDVDTTNTAGGNEALTLAGNINRFLITNNTLYNVSYIGIDIIGRGLIQHPKNGIVSGNVVSLFGQRCTIGPVGIYIDGARNITIEKNIVHSGVQFGIYTGNEDEGNYYGSGPPITTENIIVRRNVVRNSGHNISIGGGSYGNSQNCRVVHNSSVTTTAGNHSNYLLAKGTGHVAKNNIGFLSVTLNNWFGMILNKWNIVTNHTLNYNNYFPASQTYLVYGYGNNDSIYLSFEAYRDAKNQDVNSITSNPLFANMAANDFTLQANSPAIDRGDFLTRTTSAGSGTVIPVADARYFHDGYGIAGVSGDTIRIGNNTVRVTAVNYSTNTITVTPSISWNKGDGVSYPYSGAAPDIGAYEYTGAPAPSTKPGAPSLQLIQ